MRAHAATVAQLSIQPLIEREFQLLAYELIRDQAIHVAERVNMGAVVGKQIAVPVAKNCVYFFAILACDLRICETINRVRSADVD